MAETSQLQVVWKQIRDRVQNIVSPAVYNTFIKPLEPVDIIGRKLILKAHSPGTLK